MTSPAVHIAWTPEALKARAPRPRPAQPAAPLSLDKLWAQLLKDFKKLQPKLRLQAPANVTFVGDDLAATRYQEGVEALQSLQRGACPEALDVTQEAIVATLFGVSDYWTAPVRAAVMDTFLRYWTAHTGATFALDAAVETLRWHRENSGARTACFTVRYALEYSPRGLLQGRTETSAALPGAWSHVRAWLATLDDAAFAAVHARADALRVDAPGFRRAALAYAFAEPAWAREVLEEAAQRGEWPAHMPFVLLALEPRDAPRVLEAHQNTQQRYGRLPLAELPTFLDAFQHATPQVLDALWTGKTLQASRQTPNNALQATLEGAVAETIALIDSPEAAAWLAARGASPASLQAVEAFAARAPHLFIPAALEHAQASGEDGMLRSLLTRHAGEIDAWAEGWTPAQRALWSARTSEAAAGDAAPPAPAAEELPAWLRTPPATWKPKPAAFWSPSTLPAIALRSGAALSGEALEPLRLLLGHLDAPEAPAALQELQAIALPESLDAFGQALITAWIEAGGASRERWVFEGASALLDPRPPTLEEVQRTWFQGRTWYIYGRLKTWTSKQLAPLLAERGARTVSSVSNKLDFLVTEGPTPARGEEFGAAARDAVAAGAQVIGEHDLLRLMRGRLPAAAPEPATLAPSDGLELLRELIHQDRSLQQRWYDLTEAIDKLQGDAQQAAIDYVDAWLDTLPLEEQLHAGLNPWLPTALSGEDHPKLRLVRAATFGTNLNSKAGLRLFACAHLSKLRSLSFAKSPLSRDAWAAFVAAPHLRGLQRLRISDVKLDLRTASDLFAPGAWPELTHLDISDLALKNGNPCRFFADAAHLDTLRSLRLTPPDTQDALLAWPDLLAAPHLQRLDTLELRGRAVPGVYAALAAAPLLANLRGLLLNTYTHDPAAEAERLDLLASPRLAGLHTLEVLLGDPAPCAVVFANPALRDLRTLKLQGIFITADNPSFLQRADLPHLTHLTLTTTLPEGAVSDLLLSDHLPALTHLHLSQTLSEAEINRLFALKRPALQRITGTNAALTGGLLLNKLLDHLKIIIQ